MLLFNRKANNLSLVACLLIISLGLMVNQSAAKECKDKMMAQRRSAVGDAIDNAVKCVRDFIENLPELSVPQACCNVVKPIFGKAACSGTAILRSARRGHVYWVFLMDVKDCMAAIFWQNDKRFKRLGCCDTVRYPVWCSKDGKFIESGARPGPKPKPNEPKPVNPGPVNPGPVNPGPENPPGRTNVSSNGSEAGEPLKPFYY